jgi:hypothetical protein
MFASHATLHFDTARSAAQRQVLYNTDKTQSNVNGAEHGKQGATHEPKLPRERNNLPFGSHRSDRQPLVGSSRLSQRP